MSDGRGPGMPVLLLRPLGGPMELWDRFCEVLLEYGPVITFDRLGIGRSSDAPFWRSTRDMAREPVAVLDKLGIARAHVLGNSLGGMIATWLAIDAPERVVRLCLSSTPRTALDLVSWSTLGTSITLVGCLFERSPEVQPCLVHRVLTRRFRQQYPENAAEIEDLVRGRPARRFELAKQTAAAALHDSRGELHRIRAPTLVLAGQDDTLVRRSAEEALARAIPGARFELIADAGHALTLERPLELAERAARFFFEGDGAAGGLPTYGR